AARAWVGNAVLPAACARRSAPTAPRRPGERLRASVPLAPRSSATSLPSQAGRRCPWHLRAFFRWTATRPPRSKKVGSDLFSGSCRRPGAHATRSGGSGRGRRSRSSFVLNGRGDFKEGGVGLNNGG